MIERSCRMIVGILAVMVHVVRCSASNSECEGQQTSRDKTTGLTLMQMKSDRTRVKHSDNPNDQVFQFVGHGFVPRTAMQMFADGYGTGDRYGGGSSCGTGVTGRRCKSVCRDGCAAEATCLAFYWVNQTQLYGANAIGQCIWYFDTPDNCKAACAPNPYNSGSVPACAPNCKAGWVTMTNHYCGDANGCGWRAGKKCRSGPWTATDDAACKFEQNEAFLYKKTVPEVPAFHAVAEEMFENVSRPCDQARNSAFGPAPGTETYVATPLGRSFFELVKSAMITPPSASEFLAYFDTPSQLKPGYSMLLLEQIYMKKMASKIGLDNFDMSGQVVVITGASSGFGLALAIECAQRGAVVYGCARDKKVFEWGKAIALSDGQGAYVTAKATGTAAEALQSLGKIAGNPEQYLAEHHPELLADRSQNLWMVGQEFFPIYSGQVNVSASIFYEVVDANVKTGRIIFDEVDVTDPKGVDKWLQKIHGTHDKIDYVVLNAATEVGMSYNQTGADHGLAAMFRDLQTEVSLSIKDHLARSRCRQDGVFRSAAELEFRVGAKYLMARLVEHFGTDNVKQNTNIQLISSVAATAFKAFDRHGLVSTSLFGGQTGWFEYTIGKRNMEAFNDLLKSNGFKSTVLSPTGFNTNINGGWASLLGAMGSDPAPKKPNTVDQHENGKFYYPVTASGYHTWFCKSVGATDGSCYFGGATFGALQYLGAYKKQKHLQPLQRREVYVSNPSLTSALPLFIMTPFGPKASTIMANSICMDYSDASQNQDWVYQFRILNAGAYYVDAHTVNGHSYLFNNNDDIPGTSHEGTELNKEGLG